MKLSTKGRYAVTAMLDVTLHGDGAPVKLAEIAGRQDISLSYLEQLFAKLRKGGLVESVRGPGGGYLLSRGPEQISIADVIHAVNESVDTTRCGGTGTCQDGNVCLTHQLWSDLSDKISGYLSGVTLEQVVNQRRVQKIAQRQDEKVRDEALIIATAAIDEMVPSA